MAYDRLKKLGEDRWSKIRYDLLEGITCITLVKVIQEEWKEFQDIHPNTLIQQLKRLRQELIEEQKKNPDLKETLEKVSDGPELPVIESTIDCQRELEELIRVQKERIIDQAKKEKNMPMPLPHLGVMINECAELIKKLESMQGANVNDVWAQLFSAEGSEILTSEK